MNRKILITIMLTSVVFSYGKAQKKITDYAGEKGVFEWQFPNGDNMEAWSYYNYSVDRWWGSFPKDVKVPSDLYGAYKWAIGPFDKYEHNPVLSPTPGAWDEGRFGGGVHNGSVVVKDGIFYYIYRGEKPIDIKTKSALNYICDIGVATSTDGVNFTKDDKHSPFFRKGDKNKYSYEDVNVAKVGDTYYLFCNQWYWENTEDFTQTGIFLATSKDLLTWEPKGIVFPHAKSIHRNGVVLQNPHNEAVKVNGKYVMYMNYNLMAYSDDMVNWTSFENLNKWPGDEGCFALCDHTSADPDRIVLITGGNHTGNFYAIGEVLMSKNDPTKAIDYLPSPVLTANPRYPYEHGFSAEAPYKPVSGFSDCIFLNGMTMHNGKWWVYYGGSEYYTCLATAPYFGDK